MNKSMIGDGGSKMMPGSVVELSDQVNLEQCKKLIERLKPYLNIKKKKRSEVKSRNGSEMVRPSSIEGGDFITHKKPTFQEYLDSASLKNDNDESYTTRTKDGVLFNWSPSRMMMIPHPLDEAKRKSLKITSANL